MKLYTDLAEYYYEIEKSGRNFKQETEFLHEYFQKHKIKKILDLGCGTGEHVEALESKGYKVTGIDSSNQMLEVARKRFPNCNFSYQEIQKFDASAEYDAIVCLFGTFNYLLTDSDIELSLKRCSNALKTSGLFIIEVWNAVPILKIQRKPISNVGIVKLGNTTIVRNRGFRIKESTEEKNIVEVNYVYYVNQKELKDKHFMRVFYSNEVFQFLKKSHFEILNVFGNYEMQKFQNWCSRILIVAKKG